MIPANKALFKKFLMNHGIAKIFVSLYNTNRHTYNPPSIEDYLDRVDSNDAIMDAFIFPGTDEKPNLYNKKYWEGYSKRWNEWVKKVTYGYPAFFSPKNKKMYDKILRVLQQAYWDGRPVKEIKCQFGNELEKALHTPLEVYETPTLAQELNLTAPKVERRPTEEELALQLAIDTEPEPAEETEDFTFFDFDEGNDSRRRLKDDEFSLNTKGKTTAITFNKTVSDEISMSGLELARIRRDNLTGDLFFVFNNSHGCQISGKGKNIAIRVRKFVIGLCSLMEIKNDYVKMRMSKNLARTSEYLTYKIIRS